MSRIDSQAVDFDAFDATQRGFYPRLKVLILPVNRELVLASRIRIGYEGVVEISDERISKAPPGRERSEEVPGAVDPLEVTKVLKSSRSGAGQTMLILDIGLDTNHVDFKKRIPAPVVKPFVSSPYTADSGHGTRSAGLACGPRKPANGKRYGVAYESALTLGQVADEYADIPDEALIAGMEYAIEKRIPVVNMSLGQQIRKTSGYSRAFELAAQRALNEGVLLIAAAGNDEAEAGNVAVNHPANCPSVMAVGALDGNLRPWPGSCVRLRCDGEVDLVAPGYDVRSSTVGRDPYNTRSGTSSAAAIASGIATLWVEALARKNVRGCQLWNVLVDHAESVKGGQRSTTGAGLIQAPV
ncbi:MAG TPA: S8 family serine peptidase [Thermoanaerobaculia bacterium]